jgi:deazaflavin-dependent oxidoreductase (nitroreductase family)
MTSDPFPDVRWGRHDSRLRGPAAKLAATSIGSWLLRIATPLDRRLLMRTHGRVTVLGPIGAPTLLLTTTGARSGLPRTSPLLYVRGEGVLYVAGSNFGRSDHPAWSSNLLANPAAVVAIGGAAVHVAAQLLSGAERAAIWQRFVELASTYDVYRDRTDRQIRLFALRPV